MRRILILICIIFFCYPLKILCCDCIMEPLESYIDTSQYIIEVEVITAFDTISTDENWDNVNLFSKAVVKKVYKGNLEESDIIDFAPLDRSNCSFSFIEGERYLLFTYKDTTNYRVYHCSHSGRIKNVRKDRRKLRKLLKGCDPSAFR